ncbi:MAG: tetratricopeptide repeat protein [Elusimicrobiaceae bacterium]|nr:tetratricopeptide repeat protein [Elusimicrobiaceae bacterium]
MCLNYKPLFIAAAALWTAACSAGFLGLAPAGDRKEYVQARDLYNSGRYDRAITELTEYIYKTKNVKRREARAYRLLGASYEQQNNLSKALEVYLEALEFHPNNTPLLAAAANLYQQTGLTNRSIELYDRVLTQEPNNLDALSGQAANYSAMGFYSKARQTYDHFFELNPTADARYRARYAETFLRQRNFENAFINITMALADNDQNPDFWRLSAYARQGLGQPQEALQDLEAALLLAPGRLDLLAQKALWLYKDGDYKNSLATAAQILKQQPDNQLAQFIQAMNWYRLGKKSASKKQLEKISQADADTFVGQVAAKLLTFLPQK